ncbi:ComEA family DNA-binding protein [Halomonas beimenensis]|uniref:DNA uptake protein ComE-related DNA-binding protein n=1 Tax=Halomonas beimenensis TaxID=475662 RepID=A0A291P6G6_9GAMM|nr:ComEA family DNA-binding protein [Halomonas beimenensis]ATJ82484.1 DNA uptake protein ComE-related DNA-binding protein [Halomonas beimenensis]
MTTFRKGYLAPLGLVLLLGLAGPALGQEAPPINVNTADAALLAELPGIGEAKAAAIVEDREANGPYAAAADLTRVSGIGEATVEGLADQVTF